MKQHSASSRPAASSSAPASASASALSAASAPAPKTSLSSSSSSSPSSASKSSLPDTDLSPYRQFTTEEWGALHHNAALATRLLTEAELAQLRGRGETVSIAEVEQIYLPLSRLLSFYVEATQALFRAVNNFLGQEKKVPYIIGIAGSVAVGKSTSSRILREMLARQDSHPKVQILTTDSFLYPNKKLKKRGLMERKGFPESFNLPALRQALSGIKSGIEQIGVPVYSHILYDIVPDETLLIDQPDILIVEGLNVLQPAKLKADGSEIPFVSDFFDFSIYIDADMEIIRDWYVERFLTLRRTSFARPGAYFARFAELDDAAARRTALDIWSRINQVNLERNILPTRSRASLILHKDKEHHIDRVLLRKI